MAKKGGMSASQFGRGFWADTQQQLCNPYSQAHANSAISGHMMPSDQKHNTNSTLNFRSTLITFLLCTCLTFLLPPPKSDTPQHVTCLKQIPLFPSPKKTQSVWTWWSLQPSSTLGSCHPLRPSFKETGKSDMLKLLRPMLTATSMWSWGTNISQKTRQNEWNCGDLRASPPNATHDGLNKALVGPYKGIMVVVNRC